MNPGGRYYRQLITSNLVIANHGVLAAYYVPAFPRQTMSLRSILAWRYVRAELWRWAATQAAPPLTIIYPSKLAPSSTQLLAQLPKIHRYLYISQKD